MRPNRGRMGLLEGYLVLDLTAYLSGPLGTEILGALGATVIKVEPPEGDFLRRNTGPWVTERGISIDQPGMSEGTVALGFLKRNVGKLSVALDIKQPEGRIVLDRLVGAADAFIHNYKRSTAERLRVTAAEIQAVNPQIVYCALDGLGRYQRDGDERPVIDQAVMALSGVMFSTGDPDGPPMYPPLAMGDVTGGLYAAIAILAGLLGRDGRRGKRKASSMSVSMLGALSSIAWGMPFDIVAQFNLPQRRKSFKGFLVMNQFETGDRRWIYVAAISQDQWRRFVAATGIPELARPDYDDPLARLADQQHIEAIVDEWMRTRTRDEALERLIAHGVAAWPIRDAHDVMADEAFKDQFLYEVVHPKFGATGVLHAVSPVVADSADDLIDDSPAPLIGQHTRYVLQTFAGLTTNEIRELETKGVARASVAGGAERIPAGSGLGSTR